VRARNGCVPAQIKGICVFKRELRSQRFRRGAIMKTSLMLTVILVLVLSIACQSAITPPSIATEVPPAGQIDTQVTAIVAAAQTATAAFEQAVRMTFTTSIPLASDTPVSSPTPGPTTAMSATDTSSPTATRKPEAQPTVTLPTTTQLPTNTDAIAGVWSGSASGGSTTFQITVTIAASCAIGSVCGPFDIPAIPCSGTFTLIGISGTTYHFQAENKQGSCGQAVSDTLTLLPDGTLLYVSKGDYGESRGILRRIR
jgi:hypothetical protein